MSTFGERLRALRIEKGLTNKDAAKALSVSEPSLFAWENNQRTPRMDILKEIKKFYNTTYDYLLDGK